MVNFVEPPGKRCAVCGADKVMRGDGGALQLVCTYCEAKANAPKTVRVAETEGVTEEIVEKVNAKGVVEKEIVTKGGRLVVHEIDTQTGVKGLLSSQEAKEYKEPARSTVAPPVDVLGEIERLIFCLPLPADVKGFRRIQKLKKLVQEIKEETNV